MDEYVALTTTAGIENGGLKAAMVDDHEMLVAHVGDQYFITDASCPHMEGICPTGSSTALCLPAPATIPSST